MVLLKDEDFLDLSMSDYGLHRLVMVAKRDIALGKAVKEIRLQNKRSLR